jgi:uncharacterized membrane protein YhdT
MDLLPTFEWFYATPIGETIRNSVWLFPVIEAFHLVGLGVIGGAVLLVNLRLLGVGLTRQPVAQLSAEAQPWLLGALALMFASGVPLFLSEATKAYYSFAFWVKMTCLLSVLVFTFTIHRRVTQGGIAEDNPQLAKLVGIIALVLWFGVAWGGRWIGFS